jgi:hypothetical protein
MYLKIETLPDQCAAFFASLWSQTCPQNYERRYLITRYIQLHFGKPIAASWCMYLVRNILRYSSEFRQVSKKNRPISSWLDTAVHTLILAENALYRLTCGFFVAQKPAFCLLTTPSRYKCDSFLFYFYNNTNYKSLNRNKSVDLTLIYSKIIKTIILDKKKACTFSPIRRAYNFIDAVLAVRELWKIFFSFWGIEI